MFRLKRALGGLDACPNNINNFFFFLFNQLIFQRETEIKINGSINDSGYFLQSLGKWF